MAEARERSDWRRTARLCWVFAAGHLKKRGGGDFGPEDFDPFAARQIVGTISAVELGERLMGNGDERHATDE